MFCFVAGLTWTVPRGKGSTHIAILIWQTKIFQPCKMHITTQRTQKNSHCEQKLLKLHGE